MFFLIWISIVNSKISTLYKNIELIIDSNELKTFVAINLITIITQLLHKKKKFQITNIRFRPMLLQLFQIYLNDCYTIWEIIRINTKKNKYSWISLIRISIMYYFVISIFCIIIIFILIIKTVFIYHTNVNISRSFNSIKRWFMGSMIII